MMLTFEQALAEEYKDVDVQSDVWNVFIYDKDKWGEDEQKIYDTYTQILDLREGEYILIVRPLEAEIVPGSVAWRPSFKEIFVITNKAVYYNGFSYWDGLFLGSSISDLVQADIDDIDRVFDKSSSFGIDSSGPSIGICYQFWYSFKDISDRFRRAFNRYQYAKEAYKAEQERLEAERRAEQERLEAERKAEKERQRCLEAERMAEQKRLAEQARQAEKAKAFKKNFLIVLAVLCVLAVIVGVYFYQKN